MFQDSAMTPEDIKNNDAALAYFEGRSLGLVKRSAAPILESLLGKLQNKPLLGKIIAKVKKVVGKLKKKNKDKSKRFKRAPFTVEPTPKPGQALTRIKICTCYNFCLFSKCRWG